MDRRNFFRILSTTSAGALAGCSNKADPLLPLLVPEHELVPGEEQWHPAVCTECSAGCGTLVRVMEAVRTVHRDGEAVRERIAAVKKIEGNPLDPVSGGRLCARGQATVQSLYHPDRLQAPMRRTGERGKAQFTGISWDSALTMAAEKLSAVRAADPGSIRILTGPVAAARSVSLERFANALGAPPPVVCSLAGLAVERKAAELVFGWKGMPVYDLANAHHALGVGADFLGNWASPVYYSRQFGSFRQGRDDVRGHLVQAESHLSITAASADRWLPIRPGSEPQFLLLIGHLLLELGLARDRDRLPKSVLRSFESANAASLLAACGIPERRLRETVQELGHSEAPLVLGGASIVHSNSLDAIVASHFVNVLLGNIGKRGGVLPPGEAGVAPLEDHRIAQALTGARVLLLDGANPAYTLPRSSGALDALSRVELAIGFGSFLDDSGAWCDLLLPESHPLESEAAVAPAVSMRGGVAIAAPFVAPLYGTHPIEKILSDLAGKMNLPYEPATVKEVAQPFLSPEFSLNDATRQGGIWPEARASRESRIAGNELAANAAAFEGDPAAFPLQFQPYVSLQFHEGGSSHLPWMQELPDPVSSAIWGLPVEIDTGTAKQLRIASGDMVRVQSAFGFIDAPAYVHPGAMPGVVSMAIGDGHTQYGRYASGRGANPLSILAPVWEKSTGQLVTGGTRVRLARIGGRRDWIQFAAPDREERDLGRR
jgi:anaerobic selenocysteine-containing dehydrogenase